MFLHEFHFWIFWPVKIYRVPRPGFWKNLSEKVFAPIFKSKKSIRPLIFSEEFFANLFLVRKSLRPLILFEKNSKPPFFYFSLKQPYPKSWKRLNVFVVCVMYPLKRFWHEMWGYESFIIHLEKYLNILDFWDFMRNPHTPCPHKNGRPLRRLKP